MSGEIKAIASQLLTEHQLQEKELERLRRLIERHQKKLDSIKRLNGHDHLTRIFDAVCQAMPGTTYEILGPFGLASERGVTITREAGETAHISFRSSGIEPFATMIDSKSDDGSSKNTIGRMNGLHRSSTSIPDNLSDLIKMIEDQFAESRLRDVCGL